MRSAKINDYWRTTKNRTYLNYVSQIDLQGLLGIDTVDLNGGIFAFCGLNGAGKTTLITAIKDIIGIRKSRLDQKKINDHSVSAIFHINNRSVDCENADDRRASNLGLSSNLVKYIDFDKSQKAIEFLHTQTNLPELLEQYEDSDLNSNEIESISFLVGKQYRECSFTEIDIDDEEIIPYFKVRVDDIQYDSLGMGVGEHYLHFIYWTLKDIQPHSIVLIEEPETCISISSQVRLMNYIASIVALKGITIILSTHSPFILNRIDNSNIRIISRFNNLVSISEPSKYQSVTSFLGLEEKQHGTLLVEDYVAQLFLTCILESHMPHLLRKYTIDFVNGESFISQYLKTPELKNTEYQFVGIYDGDQKSIITNTYAKNAGFNWPYCFMPSDAPIEEEFKKYLATGVNLKNFCDCLKFPEQDLIQILIKLDGSDYHDWVIDLSKETSLRIDLLFRTFYLLWSQDKIESISCFIEELQSIV